MEVVGVAVDGEDAIAQAQARTPEVIVMDVSMPGIDGIRTAGRIRSLGNAAAIIMLSMHHNSVLVQQARKNGAVAYIVKQQANTDLIPAIRAAARGRLTAAAPETAAPEPTPDAAPESAAPETAAPETVTPVAASERAALDAEAAYVRRLLAARREVQAQQLAQRLHDGPVQELYAVQFYAQALAAQGEEAAAAETIRAHAARAADMLRAIGAELCPPALPSFGLEAAIRSRADQFRADHPDVRLRLALAADGERVPLPLRLALYRVCDALLDNVARHAAATTVTVTLALDDAGVALTVRDDGRGFTPPTRPAAPAHSDRLGLLDAQERLAALGGALTLTSAPGMGTTARATLPWPADSAESTPSPKEPQ